MPWAGLHNFIIDILRVAVWERLLTEDAFADGFVWALVLAFILGTISRFLLYYWVKLTGPIRNFFKATQKPATTPGPSPYNLLSGCVGGVIKLVIFGLLVMLIISGFSQLP